MTVRAVSELPLVDLVTVSIYAIGKISAPPRDKRVAPDALKSRDSEILTRLTCTKQQQVTAGRKNYAIEIVMES